MPAREEDFLELLIASERIQQWLEVIRSDASHARKLKALQELAAMVNQREAYAEEARASGAVGVLTKLLSKTDDPAWAQLVSSVQAACAVQGPENTAQVLARELSRAFSHQMRVYEHGGIKLHIKEGALGDGLGARVWLIAHACCRELVEHPDIVRGCDVLELGSGTGVCGILAAKLGAASVTLTDYKDVVLRNLRTCMAANPAPPADSDASVAWAASADTGALGQQGGLDAWSADAEQHVRQSGAVMGQTGITEEDLDFDPEDADECDDLDGFFASNKDGGGRGGTAKDMPEWDQDNMHIRFLDWSDSLRCLDHPSNGMPACDTSTPSQASAEDGDGVGLEPTTGSGHASSPPGLGPSRQFPMILGSDIVYEAAHAELVAAAVKHRLAPGGRCLLFSAVRDEAHFDALFQHFARRSLRAARHAVEPPSNEAGLAGQALDYEGGFIMIALEHEGSPAADWHRDDLFS